MWGAEAFTEPLRAAFADGRLPRERLSEMVRRILRSMYAIGVDAWGPAPEVDMAAHGGSRSRPPGRASCSCKNDGILPLATDARRASP